MPKRRRTQCSSWKTNSFLRWSIADELRAYGWHLLEAARGEHALTLMPNQQVNVVSQTLAGHERRPQCLSKIFQRGPSA